MGNVLNPQIPKDFMTSYLTSSQTLYGKANIRYLVLGIETFFNEIEISPLVSQLAPVVSIPSSHNGLQ